MNILKAIAGTIMNPVKNTNGFFPKLPAKAVDNETPEYDNFDRIALAFEMNTELYRMKKERGEIAPEIVELERRIKEGR